MSQYCERDSAIRAIFIHILTSYHFPASRSDYVGKIEFSCAKPSNGANAAGGMFGSKSMTWDEGDIIREDQSCPGQEYASGISIRYGKHVNAIGLICSPFEYHAPPPPPPPPSSTPTPSPAPVPAPAQDKPIRHVGPLPNQVMTGIFDTDFGALTLTVTGGTYTQKNGRVTVTSLHGYVMEGTWTQDTAAQKCSDGTYHGSFVFQFDNNGFTGFYGYCEGPPTAGKWNGKRKTPIQY